MEAGQIATIVVGVGIVGFLWSLHRDMRSLGERLARLEGTVDTLKDILTRGGAAIRTNESKDLLAQAMRRALRKEPWKISWAPPSGTASSPSKWA